MRELIKEYKQSVPALRFIGKKYGDSANGFGAMWQEWFENGWFNIIEKQIDGKTKEIYEDGDAYIGLIGGNGTAENPMEYWIGILILGTSDCVKTPPMITQYTKQVKR